MIQHLRLASWQPTLLNVLLRLDRYERNARLRADAQTISAEAKRQRLTRATQKRRVTFCIQCRARTGSGACDPDAVLKSSLDALVKCGLLVDDSREWLELGGVTYEAADVKGLTITLEDLPDA